jgi:hypothetical protein
MSQDSVTKEPPRLSGAAMWARLRAVVRGAGRLYLRVGSAVGGVLGVAVFVAAWALCIANFGLVFGVALGWIPAVVMALPVSIVVKPGWGLLLLAIVLMLTAPRWDESGQVRHASAAAATRAKLALSWTIVQVKEKAAKAEDALRREGLWP